MAMAIHPLSYNCVNSPKYVDNAMIVMILMSGSIPRMISFIWMMVSTLPLMMSGLCQGCVYGPSRVVQWQVDLCENSQGINTQGYPIAPENELDNDGDGYVDCSLDVDPLQWADLSIGIIGGDDCNDDILQSGSDVFKQLDDTGWTFQLVVILI